MRLTATEPEEAMARQAWNRGMEPDRVVLEHARALLLALAVLVERAAGLPAARRLWFLAVMAGGEAEARRLIVAMAAGRCPRNSVVASISPLSATDHRLCTQPTVAGDAAVLAARFRMLALAVDALLAQIGAEPPCRHAARSIGRFCRKPRLTAQFTPSPALRATSPP